MANLRLKKIILEVVDNQLKANDPPCTKDTYERLLDAGYSKSEAKDKIGAVALTEIYDILKEGQAFDEEKYKCALEEMLKQSIDYEDTHHIETEWDTWDDLVQKGYDCFENKEEEKGLAFWKDAWELFLSILSQTSKTYSVYGLVEEQDYEYPIDEWLRDYGEELGNALKNEERLAFCEKVLEVFDWNHDDDSCFRCGIGESLFGEGKKAEAYEYFENWLKDEPRNASAIDSFSWILFDDGDAEKAYEVIRNVTWETSCGLNNEYLFRRAQQLADYVGKKDESEWYQQQLDKFNDLLREWEMGGIKQIPVVKEKKIYPNDPCPCGSGKKYKKCCGKQR